MPAEITIEALAGTPVDITPAVTQVQVSVVDDDMVEVSVVDSSTDVEVAANTVEIDVTVGPEGPPGPPGPSGSAAVDLTYLAPSALSGQRAVIYSPAVSGWVYADRTIPAHAGAQIAITVGAISAGDSGPARLLGVMDEPTWTWPAPCAIFLDTNGYLTATPPSVGFLREVARAITPTRIFIEPEPAINLA